MIGPQAFTSDLRESYLRYLFSANPVGVHNPELRDQLEEALRTPERIARGPILELDPASRLAESVEELIAEGTLSEAFADLPHDGVNIRERRLYSHQVSALRASKSGRSIVVASGTGSGKTECWFYPVISELAAEPSAGLRALVLYPMNALADDQRRVRFRNVLRDTSITYGEFTGNTDERGSGDPNAPRNELQTREAMRRQPPNILITNPSMLEYLLLRPQDDALFRGADLRFLIIDEAHTYRGAYAIELAHLLRRLKARLNVAPGRLRAFVLSATLDRNDIEAVRQFGSRLTGESIGSDAIFFGQPEPTLSAGAHFVPPSAYLCFTQAVLSAINEAPQSVLEVPGISAFGDEKVLRAAAASSGPRALWELLHDNGHVGAIRNALVDRPRDISTLAAEVFGPSVDNVDDTLGRLIDAAAAAREEATANALLPARYHSFIRGLDGVSLCFSGKHTPIGPGAFAVGKWFTEQRSACECGEALWELSTCQDCAAWYLRRPGDEAFELSDERGPQGSRLLVADAVDGDDEIAEQVKLWCLVCDKAADACGCEAPAHRFTTDVSRRTCVVCNGQRVSPMMTGTMAPTQILAEEITRRQQTREGEGKKLLVFSDSRSAAAEFAAQLSRAHEQHVRRASIFRALGSVTDPIGFRLAARRVRDELVACKALSRNFEAEPTALGIVFSEFTSSYATRRRLGNLGFLATQIEMSGVPDDIAQLIGTVTDAQAVIQSLLEFMQYDSAVEEPQDAIIPRDQYLAQRGAVHYGLHSGPKTWIPKAIQPKARRAHRLYNYSERIVGSERTELLLRLVWEFAERDEILIGSCASESRQIDSKRIGIYAPSRWYRCSKCRKLTVWALTGGRGCQTKACDGVLVVEPKPVDLRDHFAINVLKDRDVFNIEEHTAQLAREAGRDVGARFRRGEINILSCSTTFELGVDIGSLQSVFMRNVPPTVANYRQRAGRAGRSRLSPAFLFTHCGPSPHDRFFYRQPEEIIVGEVSVPYFNIENRTLGARHVNSFFFASLWRAAVARLGPLRRVDEFFTDSVFATMVEWAQMARVSLGSEFNLYKADTGGAVLDLFTELERFEVLMRSEKAYIESREQALRGLIMTLMGSARYHAERELQRLLTRSLVDYLSARTVLPGYAFPINTVELETVDDKVNLSRDLRVAIFEYAPGNQVVAAKKLFTSIGVQLQGATETSRTPFKEAFVCDGCQTAYDTKIDTCSCGQDGQLWSLRYVIPDGFLTDKTKTVQEAVARAHREPASRRQYVFTHTTGETDMLRLGPLTAHSYRNAEFMFVNRGPKGEPFRICDRCGRAQQGREKKSHKNSYGKDCSGPLKRTALAHRVLGEAVAIHFEGDESFRVPAEQLFHQTLMYALLEGISSALAIDRNDLGGQVRRVKREGRLIWEIVIIDNVPGGAGYVRQLLRESSLRGAIRAAIKVTDCDCEAESSCYACLQNMWNQEFHQVMQRGPVFSFLKALGSRIEGRPAFFNVDIGRWIAGHLGEADELVVASPWITADMLHRAIQIGDKKRVTLIQTRAPSPADRIRLEAYASLFSANVDIRISASEASGVVLIGPGVAVGAEFPVATTLDDETLLDGVEIAENEEAMAGLGRLRVGSRSFERDSAHRAEAITLRRGEPASELELFGRLFDDVLDNVDIEDRYLYNRSHYLRLKSWLSLIRTHAEVRIATVSAGPSNAREQQELMSKLKAEFSGRLRLRFDRASHPSRQRHDRRVRLSGPSGTTEIDLPYGLSFIGPDGRVVDDTRVYIVRSQVGVNTVVRS